MWLAELIIQNQGNPILAIIVTATAFIVISLFIAIHVRPRLPFLYADARVSARSASLITQKKMMSLADAKNNAELTNMLEHNPQALALSSSSGEPHSLLHTHLALERNFIEEIQEIRSFSTRRLDPVFDMFMTMWEARIVKTFCRARMTGAALNDELVYPVGEINAVIIEKLKNTQTVQDIGAVLAKTKIAGIFDRNHENIREIESAIDSFVLSRFSETCKKNRMYDGKAIEYML